MEGGGQHNHLRSVMQALTVNPLLEDNIGIHALTVKQRCDLPDRLLSKEVRGFPVMQHQVEVSVCWLRHEDPHSERARNGRTQCGELNMKQPSPGSCSIMSSRRVPSLLKEPTPQL